MVSFIETKLFTRLVQEYLTDDEYLELQLQLIASPEMGEVIPGSGGVRKLRWRAPGRGKRGGYRVIYFSKSDARRDLDGDDVSEERRREHPSRRAAKNPQGDGKWLTRSETSAPRFCRDYVN